MKTILLGNTNTKISAESAGCMRKNRLMTSAKVLKLRSAEKNGIKFTFLPEIYFRNIDKICAVVIKY